MSIVVAAERAATTFFCVVLMRKTHKKSSRNLCCFLTVGVARRERATACTPCKNASQLHHTPIAFAAAKIRIFFDLLFTFRKKSYLCKEITSNY